MNGRTQARRWVWLLVLVSGAVAYLALQQALRLTDNINVVPAVLFVGAVVVPVTVLSFAVGRVGAMSSSLLLAVTGVGGVIAIVVAAIVEHYLRQHGGGISPLSVALTEELARAVVPLLLLVAGPPWLRQSGPSGGLLVGIAVGLGFGAFETMGYGLQIYLSSGNVTVLDQTLLSRGLLSPTRHVAWSGLFVAAAWRVPTSGQPVRAIGVAVAVFAGAVALHTTWDSAQSVPVHATVAVIDVLLLLFAITALDETPDTVVPDQRDSTSP